MKGRSLKNYGTVAALLYLVFHIFMGHTPAGQGFFLQSYAAVFIGCTVSRSGVPSVVGTLIGTAILAVMANGLTIMQMPSFMQDIITGGIIILAIVAQKIGAER